VLERTTIYAFFYTLDLHLSIPPSSIVQKNESLTLQLDDRDAQLRDLNKEFKECEDEIKRLMTNKLNAERGEEREDELRRQLEDLKQELNVARKAESAAEARVKKLKAKYGNRLLSKGSSVSSLYYSIE